MNELEKYVQFLQDSGETDIKGKVQKWKKDNNWGQPKPATEGSLLKGTVFEPIQTIKETKNKFNLAMDQSEKDVNKLLKKTDPAPETETNVGSTNTVSDSANGSLDLANVDLETYSTLDPQVKMNVPYERRRELNKERKQLNIGIKKDKAISTKEAGLFKTMTEEYFNNPSLIKNVPDVGFFKKLTNKILFPTTEWGAINVFETPNVEAKGTLKGDITELNKNPAYKEKIIEGLTKRFKLEYPNEKLPDILAIDNFVDNSISKKLLEEKNLLITKNQENRDKDLSVVDTFKEGSEIYIAKGIVNQDEVPAINIANQIIELEEQKLNSIEDDPALNSQIAKLQNQQEKILKELDKEYTSFFDTSTGERITALEKQARDDAGEEETMIDKSKELTSLEKFYSSQPREKLKTQYYGNISDIKNLEQDYKDIWDIVPANPDMIDSWEKIKQTNYFKGLSNREKAKEVLPYMSDAQRKRARKELGFLKENSKTLFLEAEALKTTLLLNRDPASIEQDGVTRFIESAAEATFGDGNIVLDFGTSKRKELDQIYETLEGADIKFTKEQKLNFERSLPMEIGESVGAFVPELFKFAVANKIAGAAGITRVLGGLMKSTNPIDKIKGFMGLALLEEVKFKGVTAGESELGAGAFFFAGGAAARALMPFRFTGKAAFANPALEKILLAGVGGATASEVAVVGEGFLKALEGNVDFEAYMDENYGEDAKAMRRFVVSVGTFAAIGATSMKSTDFMSMSKKYELLDKLQTEVNNNSIIKAYTKKRTGLDKELGAPTSLDFMNPAKDYKALTKTELEQKKNSINLLKRDIFLSEQSYNDLVMSDQLENKDAAEKALAEGNLNFIEKGQAKKAITIANANIDRIKRKVNTFKNNVERSGILLGNKKLKVIVTENGKDAQGKELIASDSKAEYIAERDGIPLNAIVINISKMRPGVGGHELGHAFFKAAFNANPKAAESLKSKIETQVEPVLDGFFVENTGSTFKEFLNKTYEKELTAEEYIFNVVEQLSKPKFKAALLKSGVLPGLKRAINNTANSMGLGFKEKDLRSASDVLEFLSSIEDISTRGGATALKKKFDQFKGIKVDGEKLIDIEGEVITLERVENASKEIESTKNKRKLSEEQDSQAQDKVKEIQKEQKEGETLAKKFNKPFIKSPKQRRLENELTDQIKPTVDSFVESRTKALYDPIAPDAKKGVTRQEFVESMKSDIETMVLNEFTGKQALEKFITNRGFLRANNLAERLGIKSVEKGIEKGIEAADKIAAEEIAIEPTAKTKVSKIKPSSFLDSNAVTKIKEQINQKIKGVDVKNLTFKKLGNLTPEIIAKEIGIDVKKLIDPASTLTKAEGTAIQQFVSRNADKLLKILPEGAVVEAATEKLLGTSTGVPNKLLKAFYTKQARLSKSAGLSPYKLNKGISRADFLKVFGIVDGVKQEGFKTRSPQAQALKGIANLYGKLVTNEIVRSSTDLNLDAKRDIAAGKNPSMASKEIVGKNPKKGIKEQIHQDKSKIKLLIDKGTSRADAEKQVFKEIVSQTVGLLTRKDGISAGFGNSMFTYIATPFNLSSGGNSARRNYVAITDNSKTRSKDKAKTKKALENNELFDLSKLVNQIKESGVSKLGPQFTPAQLKQMSLALRASSRSSIAKNKDNAIAIRDGKNNLYEGLYKTYDANPKANLSGLKQIIYPVDQSSNATLGRKIATAANDANKGDRVPYLEHWMPYGQWALTTVATFPMAKSSRKAWIKYANEHYYQENISSKTQTAVDKTYVVKLEDGTEVSWKSKDQNHPLLDAQLQKFRETGNPKYLEAAGKLSDIRKYPGVHTEVNPFTHGRYGVMDAAKYGLKVSPELEANLEVQHKASSLINKIITKEITKAEAQKELNAFKTLAPGMAEASKLSNSLLPDIIKYNENITVEKSIAALQKTDISLQNGRRLKAPRKEIYTMDLDDTLIKSKSKVEVEMPDGKTFKINATEFAKRAIELEKEGAQFNFAEFEKIIDGEKGPLFKVLENINAKKGLDNFFILTARPAAAAPAIKKFFDALGYNIPLENITGLGDGKPQAKAGWIMGKAAEGFNDFYFADDALSNVTAVKKVLSQIDVKSKVQQARASKDIVFNTVINEMIEESSGIKAYKEFSAAKAKTVGASKGKFNFFIPASAEDFTGLLYKMLGKGKVGDAQMAFLKTNLLDTYDRAESSVTQAKIAAANDFKALKTNLKTLPNSLSKPTGVGGFTFSHAVRVAAWTKQGMEIPGLSKKDIKELNNFVNNNAELKVFTNELINIQKGKPYPKPGKNWLGGNITSDIINDINKVNRAEYQQEWRENVDIIFSEKNLNKMEAAYGTRWREAMEDSLRRMKAGSNRPPGGNRITDGLLDWLNNSVGAVMFLNTRSALLQTISSVNFVNWGDNNIVKAGLAFANQKQYWKDYMKLMNSDYLVERRNGLKINVSESEIADAVKDSNNKPKAAIAFLLSKGFVMTRFADSFAIAAGGSTFYRNRIKSLVAKGMDQKAAEKQAFEDFRQIAEESQQSSNPNRISAQQASGAGRVVLAWANTPMQYARIQKRAAQDLINGRGDWKTNVSKIAYYGVIQNLIFNALQQAVFALGFGEDEEETQNAKKEEKIARVANGMIDSQLKGLGIGGAAVVALKSTLMELGKQHAKDRPKYEEAVFDLLGFSPPLGSKIQKINSGLRSFSWNMKDMQSKGYSLDNPAYLAGAQITTGLTNVPFDRVMKKLNSMRGIVNEQSALWQKVALGLGWSTWDVGLGYYGGFDAAKVLTPEEQAIEDVNTMKKETKTQEQIDMLLDLGLTKKEIKALGKEQQRVEKIIELQKTETKPEVKPEVKVENVKEEPKPEVKQETKPRKETAERKLRRQFDSIKGENKPEQVKTLLDYGLSKKQIRELRYEKNRVEKILELMYKNKKK